MRLLVSVLAIVLLASYVFALPVCVEPMCVALGQNCTNSGDICPVGSFCNLTDPVNLVFSCVSSLKLGSACTQDEQCAGEAYNQAVCWNGTCTSVTYTQTEGQACSDLSQCNNNFYCNNSQSAYSTGVCLPFLPNGANCSSGAVRCGPSSVCNLQTCIPMFSVPVGGQCRHSSGGSVSLACGAGLYCATNNSLLHAPGVCTVGFASSNQPCNGTGICSNPQESCECQGLNAVCTAPPTYSKSQVSDATSYFSCLSKASCTAADPTCCKSESCFLYKSQPSYIKSFYHSCFAGVFDHCNGLSRTALIAIIVGACVGGVLLIAIIAFCVRRRHHHHHYESIHH